ncbi:MAG: hypothetical protein CML02_20515 [Pseudooceanicola sp.]|jgi:ElaB/YqjD/DUF883 family membrane-anchored ribosome-binding protein|nr:hypothetical protein [Pseudooceanicola sp.]|tara:strand:- start:4415 stop:4735 length:321 start_codon:yes stop_codon:yes gene_type:complete
MANVASTIPTNTKSNDVSVDDLSKQIATLRKDLSNLTSSVAEYGRAKTDDLKTGAMVKGSEAVDEVTARAREAQAQANQFITTQPGLALGIAAGAGFLVGLLTSRR